MPFRWENFEQLNFLTASNDKGAKGRGQLETLSVRLIFIEATAANNARPPTWEILG